MAATLKQEITRVLEEAGFSGYETHLPVGGTFEVIAGAGAEVRIAWWDSSAEERRALLERIAVALRDAGFEVTDQGDRLYVAQE